MDTEPKIPFIASIDPTVPNSGRVYDYVLGGTHNFEVDRRAAEYMISLLPAMPKWVRMLRMFLQEAVLILTEEGFDCFLDLASGLPTMGHIHEVAPNAKVIYVDNDPFVVAYGTLLLGDNPRVRYIEANILDMDAVLTSPVISELFGDNRKVAIGFTAMTCFLNEEENRRVARALYDWAAPGSKMFATFESKDPNLMTPQVQKFLDAFAEMGTPFYFITPEEAIDWMKPWEVDERGFRPLTEWLGLGEDYITEEDRYGVGVEFYGVIFVKR